MGFAMILSYNATIMAGRSSSQNQVRQYRELRGWSQAELARRTAISRAAVSAIECQSLLPSVAAALALANVFGSTVECLFGKASPATSEPGWAWPPPQVPCRYWHAQVHDRIRRFPVETTAAGELAHDGIFDGASFLTSKETDTGTTLVMASCDPAAAILSAEYVRRTGFRLLALNRSSRQALTMLGQGLIHVAGIHFATEDNPDSNVQTVRGLLGSGYRLLRIARWQEGLAVAPRTGISTVRGALRSRLRWIGREQGSAARQCQDQLLNRRPPPRRLIRDHRGVATAIRAGWADIGVCHRLVTEEAGLRFLSIRHEGFDLCYHLAMEGDLRIQALLRTARSLSYRNVVAELPGYDLSGWGEVRSMN
jgi:molybdate-binding protein/transcriptional regulator with XRE-family HTH domain